VGQMTSAKNYDKAQYDRDFLNELNAYTEKIGEHGAKMNE
jgi:hypothetical protein